MMSSDSQLRVNSIGQLTSEIARITGGGFETWAYRLLEFLEPTITWSHRGTTLLGASVGRTVDSAGRNARHIAECSSQQTYFTSGKPIEDLDKALSKHPQARHIRLLAAATAGPADRSEVDNKIAAWEASHPNVLVTLYDGRQLATEIVDRLDSDALVDALSPDLPSLRRIAEENAFSHALPRLRAYVPRPALEESALVLLRQTRRVVLAGLSGTGKSDLAVRLAHELGAETAIWLDASALSGPEELRSVPVLRRGFHHNLLYMLKERSCVAILDNLPAPWPETVLESLAGPRSYVIITSQTGASRTDVVEVGNPDAATARKMLEAGARSICPDPVFDFVYALTGGHSLLMRILGMAVSKRNGDWEFARKACETVVTHGEDERMQKVCCRVLEQHLPSILDELRFFRWCESPWVDASLLEACVSPLATQNLDERNLLAASGQGVVRLHEIVFRSAEAEVSTSLEAVERYRRRLDELIADEDEKRSLVTQRVARRHEELLLREHRRRQSSAVLYALARNRSSPAVVAEFGDLPGRATALPYEAASRIEIRAIIEAIEATYSLTAAHESNDAARSRLDPLMSAFDHLESSSPSDEMRREVRHHRAKMLVRLKRAGEAEQEFRQLLDEEPRMYAAKLQLTRLVAKTDRAASTRLARDLVELEEAVPPTVRVAAWAELARLDPAWVAENVDNARAALKGLDHGDVTAAYDLVASLGASLAYRFPDAALAVFAAMGEGEPVLSAVKTRLNWARAQVSAAKAIPRDDGKRHELLERARRTYETVDPDRMPKFFLVQFGENLILLKDYEATHRVLKLVAEDKRDAFWWHRNAQAQLGLGNRDAALSSIGKALEQLEDQRYRSAFLELRFEIRREADDRSAVDDLREAISSQPDGKYKEQLQRRLEAEEGGSSA